MIRTTNLDIFTRAYIETALWSSNDESTPQGGEPMDANYSEKDIHPDTLAQMVEDCSKFQEQFYALFSQEGACLRCGPDYDEIGHAGHDFWLTRNGHGAGFWDGSWSEDVESQLTRGAKAFGEFTLYIGDDGLIHGA